MNFILNDGLFFVIADPSICNGCLYWRIDELLAGGVSGIVLRAKHLKMAEFEEIAIKLYEICKAHHKPLIINHFNQIAQNMRLPFWADINWVKNNLSKRYDIVPTFMPAHDFDEAYYGSKFGASFLVASPIFHTSCKPNSVPLGVEFVRRLTDNFKQMKVLALGGISQANLQDCIKAGASGIVIMSEAMNTPYPRTFAKNIKSLLDLAYI